MIAWTRRVALRHGRLIVHLSPLDLPPAGSAGSAERRLPLLDHPFSPTMAPSVDYYCPCLAASPHPPLPHLASSSYSFHPLHNLFFCEECDAVRCNRCVMVEVSGYYCPNCLFEVPSASVRAEKNRCAAHVSWWRAGKLTAGVRCARNCFLCPNCRNTLSVVPSDPPNDGLERSSPIVSTSLGEPPFFLYCNHCRWDSAEVGITFEKPTGLAGTQPLAPSHLYLSSADFCAQHSSRSSKTPPPKPSSSTASKSISSPTYVHPPPLPPSHPRPHTITRTPSQPQRPPPSRGTSPASASTTHSRAAAPGATSTRTGRTSPTTRPASRSALRPDSARAAARRTSSSCAISRRCRRWLRRSSGGRIAGHRRCI